MSARVTTIDEFLGAIEPGELIMTDVRVVIVYHSGRGHTAKQAAAVRAGAERVRSVCTLLLSADDVQPHWTDLHSADAIIFGARNDPPVNHLLPKVLPFHLRGTIALGGDQLAVFRFTPSSI